jgi:hypothetical protein
MHRMLLAFGAKLFKLKLGGIGALILFACVIFACANAALKCEYLPHLFLSVK